MLVQSLLHFGKSDSLQLLLSILICSGTDGNTQMVVEIVQTLFKNKTAFVTGGNVDAYFNDAFFALWNNGLRDDFLTLRSQNPTYDLWVC